MIAVRFLLAFLLVVAAAPASGQTGVPQGLQNRPPVAAPTSAIAVAPIEVVRSSAEVINDFGGGLIEALLASHGLSSAALVAAQDNRIIVSKLFGCCPHSVASFGQGFSSDLLASIAVMQLVERQRLRLDDPVPQAGDVTVAQVLTHQADPALLAQLVEVSSGAQLRDYVLQNVLSPLASDQPQEFVGRLLVALLNQGTFEGREVLQAETLRVMTQRHFSLHDALPGWTYGFAEMRRNGWRALQWDGPWSAESASEARIVLVPEANLAYFVAVAGRAPGSLWRTLDDRLFDRILPPREPALGDPAQASSPDLGAAGVLSRLKLTPADEETQRRAREVAGLYEASDEPLSSVAPLKTQGTRLRVQAPNEYGNLILSGAENVVLDPRPDGYWAALNGNLNAVLVDGRLVLSTGLYRPVPLWKRSELYASLALMFALGAAGAFYGERRAQSATKAQRRISVGLACAVGLCLAAALFAWHASPVL